MAIVIAPRSPFFYCMNPKCPDHEVLGKANLTKFGPGGASNQVPILKCRTCGSRFSIRKGTALENCQLPTSTAFKVLDLLTEGLSAREVARRTAVDKNTVCRLAQKARGFAERVGRTWPAPAVMQTLDLWRSMHKPTSSREWATLAFMMPFAMGAAFWAVRPPKWWRSPDVIPAEPKAETAFTAVSDSQT